MMINYAIKKANKNERNGVMNYDLYERNKETYNKPYDIKCGYVVSSSKGKYIVFPTEEEAWEFIRQNEREERN